MALLFALLTALQLCLAAHSYGASPSTAVKRGGHFHVVYFGAENSLAGHLISLVLEEAYIKVGADLLYWPTERLGAELYPKKEFFDITRSPSWVGAIYDGKIKMPAGGLVERTGELERVLFHEYTHAVVYRLSAGRAPAWLNEGLAQYEEGPRRPGFSRHLKALLREGGMPLSSLERSFLSLPPAMAVKAYALSLSVTGYIIDEFGFSALKRILVALGKGQDLDSALRASIFLSYADLEQSWRGWASR
ncbi:MAG: peptidase MA family metallohydrolase [Thermodesulfobacteriota bacterium]